MRKLLLGLIGLLCAVPAVATDLPSGYTELEYIESTGTQWIDTGVVPSSDMRWELDNEFTGIGNFGQGGSYNGLYDGKAPVLRFDIALTSSSLYLDYGNINGITIDAQSILNHRMIFKIDAKNMQWAYGGNTGTFPAYTDTASTRTKPIYLFARNDGTGVDRQSLQKTYSSKIYKNEALVQELIPAKNSSGVVGMYDTVSGTFFTNAGTGEFIAGPVIPEQPIRIATTAYNAARFSPVVTELNDTIATIRSVVTNTINQTKAIADLQATKQTRPDEQCPAGKKCLLVEDNAGQPHWYEIIENAYSLPNGYTALEYLQGSGSTHIVTGVTINSNIKIDIKYEILTPGWLLGGTTGETGRWGVTSSNTFYSGTSGVADISSATNLSGINTATFNYKTGATVNGVNIPFGTEQTYGNVTAKQFYLFSADGTGVKTQEHKIYYANIYNGETLVRNLVPARRNSDNVLGLYDLANDVFYTNAGTGTFTAGPEI